MSLSIYLIRHGETEWSITGQHTGRTDIPLTPRGEAEALEIVPSLKNISFSHVLTSPLQRAKKTCELSNIGTAATIEPDLSEWDYGDYEGKCTVDIRKKLPEWNIYIDGCPHGESAAAVSKRADRLIVDLRLLSGNVAIFSHGHFGSVLAVRWIGLPVFAAQHFPIATASINILGYDEHHPKVPVIALWNATQTEQKE